MELTYTAPNFKTSLASTCTLWAAWSPDYSAETLWHHNVFRLSPCFYSYCLIQAAPRDMWISVPMQLSAFAWFFFFFCVCVYVWVYMCVHCLTTVCVSCGCGLVVFGACESIFLDEIQTACSSTLSSVILRFCSLHTLPCPFVKYSSALVKWHTSIIHSAPLVSSYPCSYSAVKPEGSSALGSSTPL